MAIPTNLTRYNIAEAINFIKQSDIPEKHKSIKYEMIDDLGDRYPLKYVIAVANHLVNKVEISTDTYNAIEAKNFLEKLGYKVENKQEQFKLIITADSVTSTDERFTMENIGLGDNYKPLDSYFENNQGKVIRRNYNKGERRNSNQTMPRIACQVFENKLESLSIQEKEEFPICQYSPSDEIIKGIFSSIEEYKKYRNTKSFEYLTYDYGEGKQFVIYCWNIFSTILFVKECLKRFGNEGDQFILTYREKDKNEEKLSENEEQVEDKQIKEPNVYKNKYTSQLIESKNIIFRGAPGTGKSYLAKEIAADIISNGSFNDYTLLTNEQKKQVEFVQFHPSYDYSDFVEGLRPKTNDDGSIVFELQDGIFTKFVARAQQNFDDSKKPQEEKQQKEKPYIFIIDEINRGEISKIFGELFFAIDPGYRGAEGEVSTQYSNLHNDPDKKFSIPDNVYIIGTMNDIDRSVDSFDFAMRRRFRFIEIKSDERLEMLDSLNEQKEDAISRMSSLNKVISSVEELNENYHIGPAYFLKLKDLTPDELWTDYLQPLLQDYIRGIHDEKAIIEKFENAYNKLASNDNFTSNTKE